MRLTMRPTSLVILAAAAGAGLVDAGWLRWEANRAPVTVPARQTDALRGVAPEGYSPRPTQPPGPPSDAEAVLELFKRATSSNTWLNSLTCGWISGLASSAWTCDVGSSCVTNLDHVVACASGTSSPFYSVCLDYAAYQRGLCDSAVFLTGCCRSSKFPACGTYLWSGSPTRSMFNCFATSTIILLNDLPQSVIDDTTKSRSTSTPTSTATTTTTTSADPGGGGGGGSSNTGAIVGGVVGGLGGIALVGSALAFLYCRRGRGKTEKTNYNAVPPVEPGNPYARPDMSQPYVAAGGHGVATPSAYGNVQTTPSPPLGYYGHQQQQQQAGFQQAPDATPPQQNAHYSYSPVNAPDSTHSPNSLYPPPRQHQQQHAAGLGPGHSPDPSTGDRTVSGQSFGSGVPLVGDRNSQQWSPGSVDRTSQQWTSGGDGVVAAGSELEANAPAGHAANPIEMATEWNR